MHDIERSSKKYVLKLLKMFPCVVILGARQVGKTTLLKQTLPNAPFFDLERSSDYERISSDVEFFLNDNPTPLVFDEAQILPSLFNALRVKIDENRKKNGQYLLSGSSSPELLKNISESLAGRIAVVELGGLMWNEAISIKISKVYDCIKNNDSESFIFSKKQYEREPLYELCLKGAYPEPFIKRNDTDFFELWFDNYINTYINRDVQTLFSGLNLENFKRFVKMMCFSSGDMVNMSDFARSLSVTQPTIKSYFNIATGTFLWRRLLAYSKSSKKRLIKMPKGHIRDSGLVCYLLNIRTIDDLKSHPKYGSIWEGFVIEQIIKSLKTSLTRFSYSYYRTSHQAEIDFVLDVNNEIIPIEIKAGMYQGKKQIQNMINFINENKCKYGILINNDSKIVSITENIYQIPAVFW